MLVNFISSVLFKKSYFEYFIIFIDCFKMIRYQINVLVYVKILYLWCPQRTFNYIERMALLPCLISL
nr:MAG TPA: hypothetical protein [Caudoviricetes sp.]